jgi:hypothetical protein
MTIIASLIMRFNSCEEALNSAKKYRNCPKVHFWANNSEVAHIILKVPDDNKFWSDYIREHPESTFGGIDSDLTYLESLIVPQSIEVDYGKVEGNIAPCGSSCNVCPTFGTCSGCPSLSINTL